MNFDLTEWENTYGNNDIGSNGFSQTYGYSGANQVVPSGLSLAPSLTQNTGLGSVGLFDNIGGADWLKAGTGALQSLGSLFMGLQANSLAQKQFDTTVDQWNKNYDAQAQAYNTHSNDKYNARYASLSDSQKASALTPEKYAEENNIN